MSSGAAEPCTRYSDGAVRAGRGTRLRVAIGVVLLLAVLALPARPGPVGDLRFPLEWFWAVGLLALVRGRLSALLTTLVLALAGASAVLKLADWGTLLAFSRPFDPVADGSVVVAGWHLLSGTVGNGRALLVIGAALGSFVALMALLAWGMSGMRKLSKRGRRGLAGTLLGAGVIGTLLVAWMPPGTLPVVADFSRYAEAKAGAARRSGVAQAAFAREVAIDPLRQDPPDDLLAALHGHDVLVVFVESYGRSVLENPRFSRRTLGRLRAVDAELAAAGISARSGWMGSPIAGGQSWLAHGTLLSGLLVDNQIRYESLLRSDRESLNAVFRGAGWRTVAVMPAITMPWPEAAWFGFDEVLAAHDLGYAGLPFNWVTMPDQFTLHRIGEVLDRSTQPVMLETALISSHAPWTPIPRMVPWNAVGDGTIFDVQARGGEAPEVLWRDPERVRENYGLSIDYAMEALGSFIARFAKDAVVVVVGDHQPAELVTGPDASRDVPFHVLSSDVDVLRRLEGWGLASGMVPASDGPSMPMDAFRERFVRAMSGEGNRE
ncbi:sulfatase-like hydrolase/transferase [Aureimonas sp. AU22]|uniref:sulfatase-like hydrolase/transferase n=1 Tax=Aureimonas sp. AU22 TaxID=1638162 RepID=UPI000785B976|nr:sulfatase-like hydrolase/transferase [Aureimonas sp. AU22]